MTGESVVWSLLDETVLFSIYKLIELYFENKKGPFHFCEMALRKIFSFHKIVLLVFIHGKDAQNIQCRILKGHSDIFLGCSFAIPPFLIYKLIIR